jgi:hypothetical protein
MINAPPAMFIKAREGVISEVNGLMQLIPETKLEVMSSGKQQDFL